MTGHRSIYSRCPGLWQALAAGVFCNDSSFYSAKPGLKGENHIAILIIEFCFVEWDFRSIPLFQ